MCYHAGFCLCQDEDGQSTNRATIAICKQFRVWLAKGELARNLYDRGMLMLQLTIIGATPPNDEIWVHLGYGNLNTRHFSGLNLERAEGVRQRAAAAAGLVALDVQGADIESDKWEPQNLWEILRDVKGSCRAGLQAYEVHSSLEMHYALKPGFQVLVKPLVPSLDTEVSWALPPPPPGGEADSGEEHNDHMVPAPIEDVPEVPQVGDNDDDNDDSNDELVAALGDTSSEETDAHTEAGNSDILNDGQDAHNSSDSSSGAHPAPPPAPASGRRGARHGFGGRVGAHRDPEHVAERGARAQDWGCFQIAQIFRSNIQIGWGATCGRHSDAEDRASTRCKKQLAYGHAHPLSDPECILALKNWLAAGFLIEADDAEGRSKHLARDPRSLHIYTTAEELDQVLRDFGHNP